MTDYIREVQRQLITVYGFGEDPKKPELPRNVPDGEYPMVIEGKVDRVRVTDGNIECHRVDMTIQELCRLSHENARAKGFWESERNVPEMLMLAVSELSEALEEYRDGKGVEVYEDKNGKPLGFPVEIADVFIRLGDLCAYYEIDLSAVIRKKMVYNATRPYKHGGKKC